jgi:hypothetical protein
LEFVHIPKTGGNAVEQAAIQHQIHWGALHYCRSTRLKKQRYYEKVPYWHMPTHYYSQRLNQSNANHTDAQEEAVYAKFDPFGPSPYTNASLFTIVRNPYARAVSEFHYYHRVVEGIANVHGYNKSRKMNAWLSKALLGILRVLQSSSNKYTIDTAGHWNKPLERTAAFNMAYFSFDGHFIPQYDFVYNMDLPVPSSDDEPLPPPPEPAIDHVLRFENLHEEFAALMRLYNLSRVVLPNPNNDKDKQQEPFARNNDTATATATAIKSSYHDGKSAKPTRPNLVGVDHLTNFTKRLIEKVYARDFAAFGYEMIS